MSQFRLFSSEGGFILRCDSDATSNEIVAMEKRYNCEIIAFLSRRYYRFQFVLLNDFDNIFL